jgi:P27 family predicted phage terminase small subunit
VPTALKHLQGAKVRAPRADEPRPMVGVPPMPSYLASDPYAVEEWTSLIAILEPLQVLTVADGRALALAASAHADHRRIVETWALTGYKPIVTQSWIDKEGVARSRIVENPLVRQLRLQKTLCDMLLGAFGLTPATRSKVIAHDGAASDEAEAFLRSRPTLLPFPGKR